MTAKHCFKHHGHSYKVRALDSVIISQCIFNCFMTLSNFIRNGLMEDEEEEDELIVNRVVALVYDWLDV